LLDPVLAEGLFGGLGEIQFANPPLGDGAGTLIVTPDDERFLEIYRAVGDRGLFVMAHPGSREGLDDAISHDRRVTWIIHGPHVHGHWKEIAELGELLDRHPNLYYTLDFGESMPEIFELTKRLDPEGGEEFLTVMTRDFDALLAKTVRTWKSVIDAHPDRFLWGTDMALPTWQWEPSVIDMMVTFSRAFIGRLAPGAKEQYAYKNAERLLGECKYPADIAVPIDIKPGSFPNSINPRGRGKIPVAILSRPGFDATTQVQTSSLTFGPTGAEPSLTFCNKSPEDVNGDGLPDVVCHFETRQAGFQSGDAKGRLNGTTTDGMTLEGRDRVRVLEK
jgi:hypothetical protein